MIAWATAGDCGDGNDRGGRDDDDDSGGGGASASGDEVVEGDRDRSCKGSGGNGRTLVFSVFVDDGPPADLGIDMHSAGNTGIIVASAIVAVAVAVGGGGGAIGSGSDSGDNGEVGKVIISGVGGGGRGEVGGGEFGGGAEGVELAKSVAGARGLLMVMVVVVVGMYWRRVEGGRGRRGASISSELNRSVGPAAAAAGGARGNTGSARLRLRP